MRCPGSGRRVTLRDVNSSIPNAAAGMDSDFVIRRIGPGEWRELRDLRIAALEDTPIAFGETAESARRRPEENWVARTMRGATGAAAVTYVGVRADGQWLGMAGGVPDDEDPGRADLVSVFVAPACRGSGLAGALVAAVANWARGRGLPRLGLWVHEDNLRARRFYQRYGFTETGRRAPYPLQPSRDEVEMVLNRRRPRG
jgi:ribosomal protein S18 acetylase RimI-like enzyme